jgi:hypothetical protein
MSGKDDELFENRRHLFFLWINLTSIRLLEIYIIIIQLSN